MTSRKILIGIILLLVFHRTQAQVEVKLSPIPLLFGDVALSVEGGISESFGIDGDIYIGSEVFLANLSGKYYFNPYRGIDRFHVGAFIGYNNGFFSEDSGEPGIGFLAGTKIVSRKNILFEVGFGVGRSFGEGAILYGKLHMGYRFNSNSKNKE